MNKKIISLVTGFGLFAEMAHLLHLKPLAPHIETEPGPLPIKPAAVVVGTGGTIIAAGIGIASGSAIVQGFSD